jgi:ribosomal protein S6--L-glutamate ligase
VTASLMSQHPVPPAAMPAVAINAADPVTPASVEGPAVSALAFDPAELARSLRRGAEVDRFTELAARQEALTAAESDELYRDRLRRLLTRARRLDRVARSGDDEVIRHALDDFRSRLEELRAFEALRRQAGLPTGYAVDRTAEERAITSLLTLAARRPHGLIAGTDEAPDQAAGSLRVRDIPFAPSPEDVPVYLLAPSSIPSDALARHVEATAASGARLRVVRDPSEIPPEATLPLVLNWGSIQPLPQDIVTLNRPEVVRVASDQVASLQRLRELAPRTVVNPGDLGLLRSAQVVGKRRQGSRGSGKAVLRADGPIGACAGYDCYQEFISERREYRLSVLSDRIVSAYVKRPPAGTAPDDLRPAWSFERAAVIPRAVAAVAKEGARRVGLDYAGVDVVEDLRTGRVYCLEANAAPGMSEDTIKSVYSHIQHTLRGRLARAS